MCYCVFAIKLDLILAHTRQLLVRRSVSAAAKRMLRAPLNLSLLLSFNMFGAGPSLPFRLRIWLDPAAALAGGC